MSFTLQFWNRFSQVMLRKSGGLSLWILTDQAVGEYQELRVYWCSSCWYQYFLSLPQDFESSLGFIGPCLGCHEVSEITAACKECANGVKNVSNITSSAQCFFLGVYSEMTSDGDIMQCVCGVWMSGVDGPGSATCKYLNPSNACILSLPDFSIT